MSKKWFLTLIFPFLFVILSGFGNPQQDQTAVEKRTQSDSLTVNLKFQNPELVLKDERNFDLFNAYLENQEQSNNSIANAINQVTGYLPYIIENQERRYVSALDYLEQKSGYSSNEIENFIKQKRLSEIINSIVLITSIIMAFIFILKRIYDQKLMDWRIFLTKTVGAFILIMLLYYTLESVLCSILFPESYRFYSLINLSG